MPLSAEEAIQALRENSGLEELELREFNSSEDELGKEDKKALNMLGRMIGESRYLRKLSINNQRKKSEGLKALFAGIGESKSLQELYLGDSGSLSWDISVSNTKALAKALEKNRTLTTFHFCCRIYDDIKATVLVLVKALEKNHMLTTFKLWYNISDRLAVTLAKMLEKNDTLEKLYFGEFIMKDEGVAALTKALEKNRTLTELNFSNDWRPLCRRIEGITIGPTIEGCLSRNKMLPKLSRRSCWETSGLLSSRRDTVELFPKSSTAFTIGTKHGEKKDEKKEHFSKEEDPKRTEKDLLKAEKILDEVQRRRLFEIAEEGLEALEDDDSQKIEELKKESEMLSALGSAPGGGNPYDALSKDLDTFDFTKIDETLRELRENPNARILDLSQALRSPGQVFNPNQYKEWKKRILLLATEIDKSRSLQRLDLSFNSGVGSGDVWEEAETRQALIRAIGKNRSLQWLDFSNNDVGPSEEVLEELARAIEENLSLKWVDLSWNKLGEANKAGLKALFTAIGKNQRLRWVDLGNNELEIADEEALEALFTAMYKNKNIKGMIRKELGEEFLRSYELLGEDILEEELSDENDLIHAHAELKRKKKVKKLFEVLSKLEEKKHQAVGGSDLEEIIRRLQENTLLQELTVCSDVVELYPFDKKEKGELLVRLFAAIGESQTLRKLDFTSSWGCSLGCSEENVRNLTVAIEKSLSLQNLCLGDCRLSNTSKKTLKALFTAIAKSQSLRWIDLANNYLEEHIEAVLVLKENQNLNFWGGREWLEGLWQRFPQGETIGESVEPSFDSDASKLVTGRKRSKKEKKDEDALLFSEEEEEKEEEPNDALSKRLDVLIESLKGSTGSGDGELFSPASKGKPATLARRTGSKNFTPEIGEKSGKRKEKKSRKTARPSSSSSSLIRRKLVEERPLTYAHVYERLTAEEMPARLADELRELQVAYERQDRDISRLRPVIATINKQCYHNEVLDCFYNTLRIYLRQVFLAAATLNSGLVKREHYTTKDKVKDIVAKFALASSGLSAIVTSIAGGIKLAGEVIEIAEFVEAVLPEKIHHAVEHAMEKMIGKSEGKKLKTASELFASNLEQDICLAQTAILVTNQHQEIIQRAGLSQEQAKLLAENAAFRIWQYVTNNRHFDSDSVSLSRRFALSVSLYKPSMFESIKDKVSLWGKFAIRIAGRKVSVNEILSLSDIQYEQGNQIVLHRPAKPLPEALGSRHLDVRSAGILIAYYPECHWRKQVRAKPAPVEMMEEEPSAPVALGVEPDVRGTGGSAALPEVRPLAESSSSSQAILEELQALRRKVEVLEHKQRQVNERHDLLDDDVPAGEVRGRDGTVLKWKSKQTQEATGTYARFHSSVVVQRKLTELDARTVELGGEVARHEDDIRALTSPSRRAGRSGSSPVVDLSLYKNLTAKEKATLKLTAYDKQKFVAILRAYLSELEKKRNGNGIVAKRRTLIEKLLPLVENDKHEEIRALTTPEELAKLTDWKSGRRSNRLPNILEIHVGRMNAAEAKASSEAHVAAPGQR